MAGEKIPVPPPTPQPTTFAAISHPSLTFGLEIEFALATLHSNRRDPHPLDPRSAYNIVGPSGVPLPSDLQPRIPSSPFTASRAQDERDEDIQAQIVIRDLINQVLNAERAKSELADMQGGNNQASDTTVWTVTEDSSVDFYEGEDGEKYTWFRTEIQSPAFVYGEPALQEVQTVVSALANTFRIYTGGGSIHVHVGFGKSGYTLKELKAVMALLWTFEMQIYSLVPLDRVVKSGAWNEYCTPMRERSYLSREMARQNQHRPLKALTDALEEIWKTTSVNEMVGLLTRRSGGRLGFNIHNLEQNPEGFVDANKSTIEVRLHYGCLDAVEIKNWLIVCCRLVKFPILAEPEPLIAWLRDHISDPNDTKNYRVLDLLKDLQLPSQAHYYEEVFQQRKAEEEALKDEDDSDIDSDLMTFLDPAELENSLGSLI